MANIRIGGNECSIPDIVNEFLRPPMDAVVRENWSILSDTLKLPYVLVKKLRFNMTLGIINEYDIVNELLINWLSYNAECATMGNLLKLLEQKPIWKGVEGFLRTKIQQDARNFDDLDEKSQEKIMSCAIQFLGKESTLNVVKSQMNQDDFISTLKEHVDKHFIWQALQGNIIQLDKVSVSNQLPYYINRTLLWKRKLNPAVFQECCPDIFVVESIQRHHLSILAKPNLTDKSGGQIDKLNVRFILLECEKDFKEILRQAKVPVHRIRYENDQYYWKFTAGSLQVIRSFLLDNEIEEIMERSLVDEHLSTFCSRPLAIVSSPGMGKSLLLQSIAYQITKNFPERLVIFVEMRCFIQQLQYTVETPNLHAIKDFLASFISITRFGQSLICKLFDDEKNKFEVFLDGLDEIPLEQLQFAKQILTCLLKSKNIRAYITSRAHLLGELEDTVGVISFDIIPFQPNDQINFLCGFWKNQLEIPNMERLKSFAYIAIKDLTSDFIGVPIQCFLLAEIYLREVERFLSFDTDFYQIHNSSKSMCDLYIKFFQIGFGKVPEKDRDWVRKYHWVQALKLLFPYNAFDIHKILENKISPGLCALETVYAVGVLQAGKMASCPVFVHKTLAEFLVGEMIAEYLKGNQLPDCELMVPFILEKLLAICPDTNEIDLSEDDSRHWIANVIKSSQMWKDDCSNEIKKKLFSAFCFNIDILFGDYDNKLHDFLSFWVMRNGKNATFDSLIHILRNQQWTEVVDELERTVSKYSETSTFVNSTMCFFLNAILANIKQISSKSSLTIKQAKLYQKNRTNSGVDDDFNQVKTLTKKCYKHVLVQLIPWLYDEHVSPLKIANCQELLICAATYGDVELFQFICSIIEKFSGTKAFKIGFKKVLWGDRELELTPLHGTLGSGNYKLTEHLINFYESELAQMHFLYECTLVDTWADTSDVIENKRNILNMLHSINIPFDVKALKGITPWGFIAPELFIFVSNLIGYSPGDEDEKFIAKSFTTTMLNEFQIQLVVDWALSKKVVTFLNNIIAANTQAALLANYLSPDMLRKYYKLWPFDLGTVMRYVVISKRAEEYFKVILEVCGNVNITDDTSNSLLHYAADYKKPNIITYLLSVGADVNLKNSHGRTPLSLALENKYDFNFNEIQDCVILLTNAAVRSKKLNCCIVM